MGIGTAGGGGLRKVRGGAPSRSIVCHASRQEGQSSRHKYTDGSQQLLPATLVRLRNRNRCEPSMLMTLTAVCFTHSQCGLVCISYPERKEAPLYVLEFSGPFRLSTQTKGEVLTDFRPLSGSRSDAGCWGRHKVGVLEGFVLLYRGS